MTRGVEFHTGVPDTLAFACRLLRKAYRRGAPVMCVAPPEQLEALDRALWTFVERDFVPHAWVGRSSARVLERSPIWLGESWPMLAAPGGPRRDVILGLGHPLPLETEAAARVIEVVGAAAEEVERGRALWRQYKARGLEIVHHPFSAVQGE